MTGIDPTPERPPSASTGKTILFGILGIVVTGFGALITLGGSLAGMIGIVVTGLVMRRRGKRITRIGAWVASVAGSILLAVILLGGSALWPSKEKSPALTAKEVEASRARARERMPAWLRQTSPQGAAQQAAADSIANQILENKGAMVWLTGFAAMIGSTMLGVFAGTIGWGSAMLLYRASRGHWLRATDAAGSLDSHELNFR